MAVLDSTFLIALQEADGEALAILDTLRQNGEPLRIPAAAWTEYLAGFPPKHRAAASAELENAAVFEPFDRAMSEIASDLQWGLAERGIPLGWHDAQIAATALHYREGLVTRDEAFQQVGGLRIESH